MSNSWSLTNHITQHLTRPRLGDARPPSLWPSDASASITNKYGETEIVGSCRRSTFFRYTIANYLYDRNKYSHYESLVNQLLDLEVPPDKYMRWIWEAGKLYEDFIIEQAKQSGVYVASQVQIVVPEYNLVGKLDLIVRSPVTGEYIAEEIKSIYGHNANQILGTPGMRNKYKLGSPRNSNMMQIAIYDWHLRKKMPEISVSRLLYGARDTGRFAEFDIVAYEDNGVTKIDYQGVSPWLDARVTSPITIDAILKEYKYVEEHFQSGVIPDKDFEISYSPEKIDLLYKRGELGKTNSEQHEKSIARKQENEELLLAGKKPKKELKPIEMGDWECGNCPWRKYCYGPSA